MKKFWQFKNTANPGSIELLLYGEIKSEKSWIEEIFGGSGIYAQEFVRDLQAMGDVNQITCRINSPGGDIFAAIAIYTQLKTHKAKVISIVDGIAASAATFLLMAADESQIPNGAMVMIHDPLAELMGAYRADDLVKTADTLNAIKESIVSIYVERTKTSKDKLLQMMSDETWMTADEAIENGFCDKKIEGEVKIQMKGKVLFVNSIEHDVSGFKNLTALEHAANILDKIAAANAGSPILAQFVAMAQNKGNAQEPDDTDGGGDGDENGEGAEGKKNKAGSKTKNDEEIDDDDADGDGAEDEAKDKKAKKAVKNLTLKYPKLIGLIKNQAKAEERKRIQEIDAIAAQIDPALTAKAKYSDCAMTAKDLAFEQMKASKEKGAAFLASFQADTAASGVKNVGAAPNSFTDQQPEEARAAIGDFIAQKANALISRGGKR